jgi:hypothetical protein
VSSRPDAHLSTILSVQATCHTIRTPDKPRIIRPDDVDFRPDPTLYREASVPACIRLDVSAARPDFFHYSFKLQILSKFKKGNIDSTVRTHSFIRQESQFKFNRPDVCQHGLDARSTDMDCIFNFNRPDACLSWSGCALIRYGNCVLKINLSEGHPPWSGHTKPYMDITCSGRVTVRTTIHHCPEAALKQERFSVKILKILVAQLSIQTAHVHCPDGTRIFHSSRPFEPQPINRGLWH